MLRLAAAALLLMGTCNTVLAKRYCGSIAPWGYDASDHTPPRACVDYSPAWVAYGPAVYRPVVYRPVHRLVAHRAVVHRAAWHRAEWHRRWTRTCRLPILP